MEEKFGIFVEELKKFRDRRIKLELAKSIICGNS